MFNLQLDNDLFEKFVQSEVKRLVGESEQSSYMLDTLKACDYLSVSRPTFMLLIKDEGIPTFSVGKKKLYKRTDIEKLADDLCKRSAYKNYDLLES
ncbi:helix-turn-helix domain-containing protein [Salinicoccus sp. Marseille-QA3877]